jgi:hypothetical protein
MGYYVSISGCEITIPKRRHCAAHAALCDLNKRDELKQGGSWGGSDDATKPRPPGLEYHPSRWFSWMDANYPDKCHTLEAVLQEVGFEVVLNEAGDIIDLRYDSKTGQEELFLEALAPFVKAGSYIEWQGEEQDTRWRHEFDGSRMLTKNAVVSVRWE